MDSSPDAPASQVSWWERFPRIQALAIVFAILAWVGVIASGAAWWVHQTLLDTEGWVDLVGPIATDEAVTGAVADRITEEITGVLDLEDRIASRLSPPLDLLAIPLAGFAEDFIAERVDDLVTGERFRPIWEEANRITHSTVVTILRGGAGPVLVDEGVVTLDVSGMILAVISGLGERVGDLLGVDLSGIGEGELIAALEERLGVDVPDDFGQVVVYSSEQLAAAQQLVKVLDTLFWLFPLITVLLFAGAAAFARERSRFGITLAIGGGISALLAWLLVSAAEDALVDSVVAGRGAEAVGSVVATVGNSLRATFLLLALVVAVVAIVLAAVQLRSSNEPEDA